jgi:hypothetical protein
MGESAVTVYLLWHQHDPDDDDTAMLLGVYSTGELAETRIASARLKPGFRRFPDAFCISEYTVDKDEWVAGFATMDTDGKWVDDLEPGA